MQFNSNRFGIPEVTRNIIAINVLLFVATIYSGDTMYEYLALFNYKSNYFHGWQMITHMFMHGSFTHLLFNMFGLYMFGSRLEQMWGAKRYINFYLITGLGAALLHTLVQDYEITQGLVNINQPTVGASGALFGILVAFAMYWPNTQLFLMFIPVPIKAKWAVIGYAAFELFAGISGFQAGVAHFAHLGGALFGFILVQYWNKNNRNSFY
ncbi:MAG: rhomboid family intramembrane serine protease [Bacteroidia bacterium]|jgi:membrane associated rhomboid family serine protease|nr:rhomboid family intramembrane serine protease [Bacteroidia bacterium]|tara:strand:+ start:1581 stop:2210 length:630 start_codon:yes stop_codon:yes gene_type:complete